jgi:hypothetical protein
VLPRCRGNRCLWTGQYSRERRFTLERFRGLVGFPPGAYANGPDFRRKVIEPATLEVNGLSDIGVQIEVARRHQRAPVTTVTLAWWKKQDDEFRAAMRERNRSKVGRMARLRGTVETAAASIIP